ncbi:TniQ family protein [Polynucleobacter sp. AP-RePozz3-80-G7]|uniref:TniQ family protein n=1 Tax=Polynucleobacter sp. AP-RePozz3-80-G7 TaxID=2689105 RepID=UPI001C0E19BC|nr:TniQ family protein [Polynucleobacter sp. AP-RePozz3-80-G7]MBU3639634.1 TniQ family protein [Polynucleobacter sp. AP-RePozz3-80-G7]
MSMPIHLHSELTPPPIQIECLEDESGLGYLLRWLGTNHLPFRWLKKVLGIRGPRLPDTRDAIVLSYLTGLEHEQLKPILMQTFGNAKEGGMLVYGQQLLFRDLYRFRSPQICPSCIHQKGYISRCWEFGPIPICIEHGVYLIDHCEHCKKPIRWDRPTIDICQCGRIFSSPANASDRPSQAELNLASWALKPLMINRLPELSQAPPWMRHLSMDGALRIIKAFGICQTSHEAISSSYPWGKCTSQFWRDLLKRAALRIEGFLDPPILSELSTLVYQPFLERLAFYPLTTADKESALYLLKQLYAYEPLTHFDSAKGHLSQQRLFD